MEILDFIRNWHSLLEQWGITLQNVSLFLGALFVVGFFSTREFLSWYLKIGPISRKQKALEKTLAQISEDLGKIQKRLDGQEAPAQPPPQAPPTPEKKDSSNSDRFKLTMI